MLDYAMKLGDTMSAVLQIESLTQMLSLARQIGERLQPSSLLTLEGDLAAGKTTFTKGLAVGLGVGANVNSPTFTIIKEYTGNRLPLFHMDVYRLMPGEETDFIEDYFERGGVCVIEWASRVHEILPKTRLDISITHAGDEQRLVELSWQGVAYDFMDEVIADARFSD